MTDTEHTTTGSNVEERIYQLVKADLCTNRNAEFTVLIVEYNYFYMA